MPNKQPPPRVFTNGCLSLAAGESYLASPQGLSFASKGFHSKHFSTQQLGELLDMLRKDDPNLGFIVPEILKRLKFYELEVLIDQALRSGDNELRREVYLLAIIECLNRMSDSDVFNPRAVYWPGLEKVLNAQVVSQVALSIKFLFKQRYDKIKASGYSEKIFTGFVRTHFVSQLNTMPIPELSAMSLQKHIFIPEISRNSSALLLLVDCYDTLSKALWYGYHYSLGLLFDPLSQVGELGVDGVRRFIRYITKCSLKAHPLLKFPITAIGSGTALVGIVGAATSLGVPVAPSAALGTTGVLIASLVNILASSDVKDARLPVTTLNKVFVACVYASMCSAMMARPAISKLLLHFKYGDTIPADATLPPDQATGALYAGIVLAVFNAFTSMRSTMGASARFLADRQDPQSHYSKLYREGGMQMALLYFFMLITLAVAFVYSVPMTKILTQKEFKEAIVENLAVLGVNVGTNLTTAAIFINRTIDWIYEMFHPELSKGCATWLLTVINFFLIGSFYLVATFGNGEASTKELTDNDYWVYGVGGVTAFAITPSVWQSVKMISREIISCCKSDKVTQAIFDDLDDPLLELGVPGSV